MITITNRINEKKESYVNHCLLGISLLSQNLFEDAIHRFRNSGEAFMKMIIYNNMGDEIGHDIILGKKDVNGTVKPSPNKPLSYMDLIQLTYWSKKWYTNDIYQLLEKIRTIGNNNSHDKNVPISHAVLKKDGDDCFDFSKKLTGKMFTMIGEAIPPLLTMAYKNGFVEDEVIDQIRQCDMDVFLENVNRFNKADRYILISPSKTDQYTQQQLRSLLNVNWSVIVDFNSKTKLDGGLYNSFMPEINERTVPITIESINDPAIISKGIQGNVNWIYANGLNTIPGTVTADINGWYGKRYNKLLKVMLREFCKLTLARVHVICLFEDTDYVEEIVHIFNDIEFAERDLVSFNFISCSDSFREHIVKLSKYGFNINCFSFSITNFLTVLEDFSTTVENHSVLVPARNNNNETIQIDLSDINGKLRSNGILLVHRNIASETQEIIEVKPNFYRGETISWKELEAGIDVIRDKYAELQKKITTLIQGRQSQKFNLFHDAGAGGTTISRRLAFDMRTIIPTIILTSYKKVYTFSQIDLVYMRVQRPILCIVESSIVGSIDELISECNAKKRVVIFVYVERVIKKPKITRPGNIETLSDKMRNAEEQSRFLYKVQLYNRDSPNLKILNSMPFAQTDVIDYALSISEQDYKKTNLRSYIEHYINNLSAPIAEFISYSALTYYYSQLPISDVAFRKLFTTKTGLIGLDEYLRSRQEEREYLSKLLAIETDETTQERRWRPRYSLFAETILETLLGGNTPDNWKNSLPEWSRKMIRTIRENNEFLVDEVRDILKAVYLEHEKEDILGKEEQWEARGASEKFSQLLMDLRDTEEQKTVLLLLADSYPNESHFWGHLARFCYENAQTLNEFNEAINYIDKAFSISGKNDYTILHIAGMCQRRQLEYYHRNNIKIGNDELKEIVNKSRQYFRESRAIYKQDIHTYMSEIQLLIVAIEYGKSFSRHEKYSQFLTAPENKWFFEQFQDMNNLIDELHALLEQKQTLGVTNLLYRTNEMLVRSETKVNGYIGNYKEALSVIRQHFDSDDRLAQPRLRTIYVRTLLLSKVHGDRNKILEAWKSLTEPELAEVKHMLNQNVEQNSSDIYSMHLWLQAVRYGGVEAPLSEVRSRLKAMYNSAQEYPMAQLEAAYYLYVFNAFEVLKGGNLLNTKKLEEVNDWLKCCVELSPNDKHVFEWLMNLDGICGIMNYQFKPDFNDMMLVRGTITNIRSNMQGEIRLDCGLKAFFTPTVGGFVRGRDETTSVTMNIGFRHDGLSAFRVARIGEKPIKNEMESKEINENAPLVENIEEDSSSEEVSNTVNEKEIFKPSVEKLKGLKLVGKIDLEKLKRK